VGASVSFFTDMKFFWDLPVETLLSVLLVAVAVRPIRFRSMASRSALAMVS